jgi:phosphoglycerate dehydrogenase-like enzyme
MTLRILVSEPAAATYGAQIRAVAPEARLVLVGPAGVLHEEDGRPLDEAAAAFDVAWATSDLVVDGAPRREFFDLVERSPTVRWFQTPAAGLDAPLYADLLRRGVRLSNAHVNGVAIAEYVLRAVLDLWQDAQRWRDDQAAGRWRHHEFREVYGSTWIVVGIGSVGAAVSLRARAFGARVIGVRRSPTGAEPVDELVGPQALASVLARADIVVLAAPLTSGTRGMVGGSFLAAMKEGSLLVNVARGALVDETALLNALDAGCPEAAVLDVFVEEPLPPGHPFWTHPRVVVSPHNAAGGAGRHDRASAIFLDNLGRYVRGERLSNELDRAHLG